MSNTTPSMTDDAQTPQRGRDASTGLGVTLLGAAATMAARQQYVAAALLAITGAVAYRYGYTLFRGLSRETAIEIARPLADMVQTAVKKTRRQ